MEAASICEVFFSGNVPLGYIVEFTHISHLYKTPVIADGALQNYNREHIFIPFSYLLCF
jgi:hypothetical protein